MPVSVKVVDVTLDGTLLRWTMNASDRPKDDPKLPSTREGRL
jgi:hypothetical protein